MTAFNPKNNDNVKIKNFIDSNLAKTTTIQFQSNVSQIFNVLRIIIAKNSFKSYLNSVVIVLIECVYDRLPSLFKLLSFFFDIEINFAIDQNIRVDILNA